MLFPLVLATLAGCQDTEMEEIAPGADTCKPEFYQTLPAGKQRDALVGKCLRQGQYQKSEPRTW
ncbi:MAG: entry exclusion lipoprotein TrbK [Zoogloeaceae bacterium]|nr:entry exclusion lipoprotein TrbK [Zoogloeaceae bacterium]